MAKKAAANWSELRGRVTASRGARLTPKPDRARQGQMARRNDPAIRGLREHLTRRG